MQESAPGGAVRVLIASRAPEAVLELEKLAAYADQVSLIGFVRFPHELDEDLEALQPDVVLLHPDFARFDTADLVVALRTRAPGLSVVVAVDPGDEPLRRRVQEAGAETVSTAAANEEFVAVIRSAAGRTAAPASDQPPAAPLGAASPGTALMAGSGAKAGPETELPGTASDAWWEAQEMPTTPSPAAPASEAAASEGDAPSPEAAAATGGPADAGGVIPAPPEERLTGGAGSQPEIPAFDLDTALREAGPAQAPAPLGEAQAEPIQPVRPRPPRRSAGRADLIVVFSGKGGVGKSLVATNLAVALAEAGDRVALVDLDLQFGDVSVMLHTENHATAIDALAPQGEQVEAEFIEEVMATGPSGVRALLAPQSPEFADLVNTANLRAILRELAKGYDHVIVDTPAHLEERNLEAIEMADQIVVISSFSLTSIKDTKVTLKLLQSLGIPKERLCVVLNQTRAKVSFSRSEVEENLRFQAVAVLPYEPRIDDCIDTGKPFITAEPKSEMAKQLRILIDHTVGRSTPAPAAEAEAPRNRANRRRFSLGRG